MSDAMKPVELPENWLKQSMAEAAITVECFAKADAKAKRLIAKSASDERPGEATYEIQTSDGVVIDRERVAAVIAGLQGELVAVKAENERLKQIITCVEAERDRHRRTYGSNLKLPKA